MNQIAIDVLAVYRAYRERARANRAWDATWRMVILLFGSTFVGLGIFFLLFPGPGWAIIILGLTVLATEFHWANRALNPVLDIARKLSANVTDPKHRARTFGLTVSLVAILTATLYAYVARFGFTLAGIRQISSTLWPF
jgi:uncharacterized protein (TIGR02611 family)